MAVATEDHGIYTTAKTGGVEGVFYLADSLEVGSVEGTTALVDDGNGVIGTIGEVDEEVGVVGGGVGVELREVGFYILSLVNTDVVADEESVVSTLAGREGLRDGFAVVGGGRDVVFDGGVVVEGDR